MAYIGAVLLMSLEEEPAFWALVALLDDPKYLEGYYATDLRRVQTDALLFERLTVRGRRRAPRTTPRLNHRPRLNGCRPWRSACPSSGFTR